MAFSGWDGSRARGRYSAAIGSKACSSHLNRNFDACRHAALGRAGGQRAALANAAAAALRPYTALSACHRCYLPLPSRFAPLPAWRCHHYRLPTPAAHLRPYLRRAYSKAIPRLLLLYSLAYRDNVRPALPVTDGRRILVGPRRRAGGSGAPGQNGCFARTAAIFSPLLTDACWRGGLASTFFRRHRKQTSAGLPLVSTAFI